MINEQKYNIFNELSKLFACFYSGGVLYSINAGWWLWFVWLLLQWCIVLVIIYRLKSIAHQQAVKKLKKTIICKTCTCEHSIEQHFTDGCHIPNCKCRFNLIAYKNPVTINN